MLIDKFDYDLPDHLIARSPISKRDESRLLTINKQNGHISAHSFSDILDYLTPNDVLVLNNTKVIPAKLMAYKSTGAEIEILLSSPSTENNVWDVLLKPAKRVRVGDTLTISPGFSCTLLEKKGVLNSVRFHSEKPFYDTLEAVGHVPIPPYISQDVAQSDSFSDRYQTVFAQEPGAVAAPTAGLHFTDPLLDKIKNKGVTIETVTLHIGYGTFQPISTLDVRDHTMHSERFFIAQDTAKRLNRYKSEGKRIIGVGTTTVRTLETAYQNGQIIAGHSESTLYIYPGIPFNFVDAMITNFHLPKSSLLLLVCALGGYEHIMAAYRYAIKESFRFFSFGDAMFIY